MKKYKNNFTLIELLLVIGIMGIILGAGIPGLSKLNKSQAVNGAVRSIAGQITLGRSYAVSKNRYVALVMPKEDVNATPSNFDQNSSFIMQKTRLCYVTKDITVSPIEYNFDGWVEDQKWHALPNGALVLISTANDLDYPTPPQPVASADMKVVQNIEYSDDDGNTVNDGMAPAVIFKSSGAVVGGKSYITVFFGVYPYKLSANRPSLGSYPEARNERYELIPGHRWWRLTVNQFTGRVMFDRLQKY